MPLDDFGRSVAIKLVANVDEILDTGKVDVVDGGKVEDNRLQGGLVIIDYWSLSTTRTWVIPWTILFRLLVMF